jgi:hypothetical protein
MDAGCGFTGMPWKRERVEDSGARSGIIGGSIEMVFAAVAVALLGFILKAIAAEPAGWFLVPLAGVAGIYHVYVHMQAARSARPPIRLAAISDLLLLSALLWQIDFGSWNCGHTTIDGVAWEFGWSSEYGCTLIRGAPAILLDLAFNLPAAVTWWLLRAVR